MDAESSRLLRSLLAGRRVAALATLHRGEPAVSMVPFVLAPWGDAFLVHVSELATHTRDMREHPRVGLLVTAAEDGPWPPQALPRVALQARAAPLPAGDPRHAAARAHYLARFPDSAPTFELSDFSLVVLEPLSARLVAGFGRASALAGEALLAWLREAG
ncbi:HugZ family pyridoxamine 5'-phosphate oxidase [Ramlibacter sp. MAHUQ-53]|uniref:HugZ family pyridoxamine 5'-phosphate oxidase n=1 Tax=unclassified Ramlibacter TaxID=2617605 RepID=UPI0036317EB6